MKVGSYALRALGWDLRIEISRDKASLAHPGNEERKTAVMPVQITTVSGVVDQTNANGFKLQGHTQWLNYSKFGYQGPNAGQPAPQQGQHVTVQVKQDKFIHALQIGTAPMASAPTTPPPPAPLPDAVITLPTPAQDHYTVTTPSPVPDKSLVQMSIEARFKLLETMAVAQPDMFKLENLETLTETVRNLEAFVLEELSAQKPEADETPDDLIEDEEI